RAAQAGPVAAQEHDGEDHQRHDTHLVRRQEMIEGEQEAGHAGEDRGQQEQPGPAGGALTARHAGYGQQAGYDGDEADDHVHAGEGRERHPQHHAQPSCPAAASAPRRGPRHRSRRPRRLPILARDPVLSFGQRHRPVRLPSLALAVVLVAAAPAATPAQTPIETARGLLKQYQEDPTRIDRARDLLEAAVAKGAGSDVPTLVTLARAWFLYGDERARDLAKRATELAPRDPDAHFLYASSLGSWSQAKGLLRSALALRDLRREVDRVLELDPTNIGA